MDPWPRLISIQFYMQSNFVFQDCKEHFDIVMCCEERCYDQVIDDLDVRGHRTRTAVHVINIEIQDNHDEATIGAFFICELCTLLEECEDLDNEIAEILNEFESRSDRNILHSICFY